MPTAIARFLGILLAFVLVPSWLSAKTVVLWEPGFPTAASEPVSRAALETALGGMDPAFASIADLRAGNALKDAGLLVLPYGSAFPVEAWPAIEAYARQGGNLLFLGGQPLRVPVEGSMAPFTAAAPQDTYSRALDFRHTYELPDEVVRPGAKFAWREGYDFSPTPVIRAKHFFAVEGRLNGLGYMEAPDRTDRDMTGDAGTGVDAEAGMEKLAAPAIVADHLYAGGPDEAMLGARIVGLDFDPEPGYWESADGMSLIRQAADYARQGATDFSTELLFSTLRPGESPQITVHLRNARRERLALPLTGDVKAELLLDGKIVDRAQVACSGSRIDARLPFDKPLQAGFYTVHATYESGPGLPREFYKNGFWVEEESALETGAPLGVKADFITLGGAPFFPLGANYFSTEANGWDFSGPRNAANWESDFADMQRHNVNFVRTGVWMNNSKFVEPGTGEANERFLRNVEAFLASAHRHNIAVNFTFFAFSPRSGRPNDGPDAAIPNPYLDPASVRAQQYYVLSVVDRFRNVPWLCYDLINEPSFSNPRRVFHGNTPNGDPAEVAAWHKWLAAKYASSEALAAAWAVTPDQVTSFDSVPLPMEADLGYSRNADPHQVRALDYNLFAQDMFSQWVHGLVTAIRGTGSTQLINVGQDEGGVTDRVLNQFYAGSGVSFTTNHTYWQDDALLWDSVAAKHPGMPNITGETGYQPVWDAEGTWRYDELTGLGILERKWALGFAAGSSGALQWDWDREPDFGMERSDGSAKLWESMMRDMGAFGKAAAPYATGLTLPQVAIVMPQSLQLSTRGNFGIEAQKTAVRALYQYARAEAYAVGEYQADQPGQLGAPKLIILPSPYGLIPQAWDAITARVREGAVLLVSGPFDGDAHMHATGRQREVGLDYQHVPLTLRDQRVKWPGGQLALSYGGMKTTTLDSAAMSGDRQWAEVALGKGKILFSALPLELNDNLEAVGEVYRYALRQAGVTPVYTTTLNDSGILICPTRFPHATLYVLTSESNQKEVSFRDVRSGKSFSSTLAPGRAALLLVGEDGQVLSSYDWAGGVK